MEHEGRIQTGQKLAIGYDSLQKDRLRVYSHSSQILPLFLTNADNEVLAREAADKLKEFLLSQLQQNNS